MKMKRLFKFFAVAAIIAVGFTGCSSEEPVGPGDGPGDGPVVDQPKGEDTFVSLQLTSEGKPITKSQVEPDNATNEVTTYSNLRITIFNDADEKEVDEYYTTVPSNLTFKVISGNKRIFVLANYPDVWNTPISGLLKEADPENGITTLSEWNKAYSLDNNASPTVASIDKTTELLASLTLSNVAPNAAVSLASGITADESQQTGNTNNVPIEIRRAVAKMFVSQTPDSKPAGSTAPAGKTITKDSTGIITTTGTYVPTYRVMNVLAYLYPFQTKSGTTIVTPYAAELNAIADPLNNVAVDAIATPRFDRGGASVIGVGKTGTPADLPITIAVAPVTPAAGGSYYITENVNSKERAATFAVIKAQFTPTANKHITGVTFNNTSGGKFSPTIATTDAPAGTFYLLKTLGANTTSTGVSANTVIAGVDAKNVVKKIIYQLEHVTEAEKTLLTDYANLVTDAELDAYVDTYTNGICYYRLNVGKEKVPVLGTIIPSVERNTHYQLNIDSYTKLGAVSPADLLGTGNNVGETYLTISVSIRPWDIVTTGQDV
jgi:hypothetical protein